MKRKRHRLSEEMVGLVCVEKFKIDTTRILAAETRAKAEKSRRMASEGREAARRAVQEAERMIQRAIRIRNAAYDESN